MLTAIGLEPVALGGTHFRIGTHEFDVRIALDRTHCLNVVLQTCAPSLLLERARAELSSPEYLSSAFAGRVRIAREGRLAATLTPTELTINAHGAAPRFQLSGDFWVSGESWSAARQALRDHAADAVRGSAAPRLLRHTEVATAKSNWPSVVRQPEPKKLLEMLVEPGDAFQAQMRAATHRLQNELRIGLPCDVRVNVGNASLKISPPRRSRTAVDLPIELRHRKKKVLASIRLSSRSAVLPFLIWESELETHEPVWSLALQTAAELLCAPPAKSSRPSEPAAGSRASPQRPGRAGRDVIGSGQWSGPSGWTTSDATRRQLAQIVVGHVMAIPGKSASDAAREAALDFGVSLPPSGQTWVRPHVRGQAALTLTFKWKPELGILRSWL